MEAYRTSYTILIPGIIINKVMFRPVVHFYWPAANSKNIMEYGPHMKFALDCVVLLSCNTRWSYNFEQGSSTKQD